MPVTYKQKPDQICNLLQVIRLFRFEAWFFPVSFLSVVLVIILVFAWIMDNMEDGSGSCVSVGDGKLSNKDIEMLRKLLKKLQSK